MRRWWRLLALVLLAGQPWEAAARDWLVTPGAGPALAEALAAAAPGDVVRVRGGVHAGPLVVDSPVRLVGEGWPVIDGGGTGTVVAIRAAGARFEGFVVRGSGASLDQENSGIAVEAAGVTVAGNRLEDVLFGIYLRQAPGSTARGNRIRGKELPLARRGDAVRVWYSDGAAIEGNDVELSRDVVLWYSSALRVTDNRVRAGRYGLHFMYCDDAEIAGNLLFDNSVGAFLMYSRRLRLTGNTIAGNHGPSGYGVGLKDMDDALVEGNLFAGNRVGVFLDNSPREAGSRSEVRGNLFAANDSGVVLMPNVRRARFEDNAFVENREQVARAGEGGSAAANLWLGNHWSDYVGFDADADGFGDVAYRAERLFENLTDRWPELRVFVHSPAVEALDFAARAFPVVRPRPNVEDPSPRMAPLALAGLPALPQVEARAWVPLALSLVAVALLLLGLPRLTGAGPSGRRASAGLGPGAGAALAAAAAPAPRGAAEEPPAGGGPPEAEPTHAEEERRSARGDLRRSRPGPRRVDPPAGAAGSEPRAAPMVTTRGLTKRFGDLTALDDVSFDIARGESVALWGTNGAGKTTALRALLGVMPFEGSVRVDGIDARRRGKQVRRRVGFVPQEVALEGDLGVVETLDLFARLRRVEPARVERLVSWLGLERHAGGRVGELSGGLRQRLALGVALLADPPILLLDEPTANLDPAARADFYELLLELKAAGKTLVFTSHRVEEVACLADRVLRLDAGRLVETLTPNGLGLEGKLGEVEVRVRVARSSAAAAFELLAGRGLAPRRLGGDLVMTLPAARKVEPIALLIEQGVELEDLALTPLRPEVAP